jgi:hypothetical protein
MRLNLTEAIAYNTQRMESNQQSIKQIKLWYAQGFYMDHNLAWFSSVDNKPKYCTAN